MRLLPWGQIIIIRSLSALKQAERGNGAFERTREQYPFRQHHHQHTPKYQLFKTLSSHPCEPSFPIHRKKRSSCTSDDVRQNLRRHIGFLDRDVIPQKRRVLRKHKAETMYVNTLFYRTSVSTTLLIYFFLSLRSLVSGWYCG